ncbi:LmbE family N-acetylglucosaminyl deacetylase [Micromonospora pisi]|uniref:LmbE family N-acetylglucosaminyl deacetylase n=1 Tax=Micromonospora pisi TaxID=589240 RepID=A0A495JU56_9ACTN|nr:PIG-L deacetylase family protein [Micromonospora pisi]RKR92536.1 LmbE family N-acetylglucosaminyl deacetylase [Micromonospora pisi]
MRILAIGAHPDDIELGCGATLLRARQLGASVTMLVLTDGRLGPGDPDLRAREQRQAAEYLGAELIGGGFRDGELDHGPALVNRIEEALAAVRPDLVFTHAPADSHQDHRATASASIAAARTLTTVLHYESPSTLDFQPVVFGDVTGLVPEKLRLLRHHLSQVIGGRRIDLEALAAQARFRGFQGRVTEAEAFTTTRTLLSLSGPGRPLEMSDALGLAAEN